MSLIGDPFFRISISASIFFIVSSSPTIVCLCNDDSLNVSSSILRWFWCRFFSNPISDSSLWILSTRPVWWLKVLWSCTSWFVWNPTLQPAHMYTLSGIGVGHYLSLIRPSASSSSSISPHTSSSPSFKRFSVFEKWRRPHFFLQMEDNQFLFKLKTF